uniref:Sulfatase N-terminal domain-containing protein n=1 Tax=Arion vulgaris TaxID=1028688 RepID=A0A0B7BS34_9EUPU
MFYFLLSLLRLLRFSDASSSTDGNQRPNVLFIVVDDLRPTLGCYGEPLLRTPNIDNLASKSILFKEAFSQQAVCGPSRVSLLTSRRPDTTRLYDFFSFWRLHAGNYTTLPQHFKENGYITQSVSKIFHPGVASNHTDDAYYSWTNTPYHPPTQQYKNAKICPDRHQKLGMNIVCPVDVNRMPGNSLPDLETAEFATEFLNNMSDTKPDKPFFLAVGFHKPHIPLKYPKKYKSLYPLSEVGLARNNTYPWRMPLVAWNPWKDLRGRDDVKEMNLRYPFGPLPTDYQRLVRQSYYAATSYMDAQVGKVLAALEKNGFSSNTIVAFISDHGWALGEHQEWSKYSLFEVAVKVPFILYIPGVTYTNDEKKDKIFPYFDFFSNNQNENPNDIHQISRLERKTGKVFDNAALAMSLKQLTKTWVFEPRYTTSALVELVDLFPTLAEAAGIQTLPLCPEDSFQTWLCTEGTSLMPLIRNVTKYTDQRNGLENDNNKDQIIPKLPKVSSEQNIINLLAKKCSPDFTAATSDFPWKNAVFSQYPRPAVNPQSNTEIPHLVDIRIMGYSMWTADFHYTEWVSFIPKGYKIVWEESYGRELYFRTTDPDELNNVSLLESCFPLVMKLSKQLRLGWRNSLPN